MMFSEIERTLEHDTAEYLGESKQTLPRFDLDLLDGAPPPDRKWVLPGFIPCGEITLFTGPGGAGKSLFAQQLATALAGGVSFLGLSASSQKTTVLYATAEDDECELHRRERNVMRALDLDRADLGDRLGLISLRGRIGNELVTFDHDGKLKHSETFKLLRNTVEVTGANLLILDNLAHLFAGNENDRGQVTAFVNALYSLVRNQGVTILLLGHPNKSGDSYSGSTAWLNAVRSQIEINRVQDGESNVLDPDARVLTLGKANYARAGAQQAFRWHEFAFVLEEDLPSDARAELAEAQKAAAENEAYLRCLAAATDRKRAVSHHPGVNYYASTFTKMPEGRGNTKAAFERAFERLLALGAIELDAKLWKRENRTYKYGIRAVDNPAEKCTDQAHRPLHQPPAPTRTDPSVNPARTDPPIPKGIPGAATKAATPDQDKDCPACDGIGCHWCEQ
jgi:RecA-family ATPase